jgi:hypothetical protein
MEAVSLLKVMNGYKTLFSPSHKILVLKNAKTQRAGDKNERVATVYSTEIMEKAKASEILRGPSFYNRP